MASSRIRPAGTAKLVTARAAATLVELIVVLAIMGVLMGLLIPAVQKIRGAMARTRCTNNLRQLGLSLHQYHGDRGLFPPGMASDRPAEPMPYISWNARLLPYLEEDARWRLIQEAYTTDRNFLNIPPHDLRNQSIAIFECPSDSRSNGPGTGFGGSAFTWYLGVEGTDQFFADGVLYVDSQTRVVDIRDGTSHTLMIGERPPSANGILGWWYAGWGQDKDGSAEMVLGAREINITIYGRDCPRGPYHFGPGRFDNQCDTFHFWSLHSGGANFAFADGSVHFLRYSADHLLPALASRAGNESVPFPD